MDKPELTLEVIEATKVINRFVVEAGAAAAEVTQVGTLRLLCSGMGQPPFATYTPIYQDMKMTQLKGDKT